MSSLASVYFWRSGRIDGTQSSEPQNDVDWRASSASWTVSRTVSSG